MQTVHHTLRVADAVAFGQNTLHTHQQEAFRVCTQLDKQQHFLLAETVGCFEKGYISSWWLFNISWHRLYIFCHCNTANVQ